jgi:hypothetical protein
MTTFRFSPVLLLTCLPVMAEEVQPVPEPVVLPSGLSVTLIEAIWEPQTEPEELWLRLRYLAPAIAQAEPAFDVVGADMQALCRWFGLSAVSPDGAPAQQVVVSLSAEPIEFGEANPDVRQYFEAYRLTEGDCILEQF